MGETRKILGQSKPAATTLADCYTVPDSTQAVVSTILICNRGADTNVSMSQAVAGAADSDEQYFIYLLPVFANDTVDFTTGMTLNAGDVIRCYSDSGDVSFNISGVEIN